MDKRKKGTIIESGDNNIDSLRVALLNKILQFDQTIDYSKFDFLFGSLQNRPKRLVNYLISLDCIPHLEEIAKIILNV